MFLCNLSLPCWILPLLSPVSLQFHVTLELGTSSVNFRAFLAELVGGKDSLWSWQGYYPGYFWKVICGFGYCVNCLGLNLIWTGIRSHMLYSIQKVMLSESVITSVTKQNKKKRRRKLNLNSGFYICQGLGLDQTLNKWWVLSINSSPFLKKGRDLGIVKETWRRELDPCDPSALYWI